MNMMIIIKLLTLVYMFEYILCDLPSNAQLFQQADSELRSALNPSSSQQPNVQHTAEIPFNCNMLLRFMQVKTNQVRVTPQMAKACKLHEHQTSNTNNENDDHKDKKPVEPLVKQPLRHGPDEADKMANAEAVEHSNNNNNDE